MRAQEEFQPDQDYHDNRFVIESKEIVIQRSRKSKELYLAIDKDHNFSSSIGNS